MNFDEEPRDQRTKLRTYVGSPAASMCRIAPGDRLVRIAAVPLFLDKNISHWPISSCHDAGAKSYQEPRFRLRSPGFSGSKRSSESGRWRCRSIWRRSRRREAKYHMAMLRSRRMCEETDASSRRNIQLAPERSVRRLSRTESQLTSMHSLWRFLWPNEP